MTTDAYKSKFHPGIYPSFNVSYGLNYAARQTERLARMKHMISTDKKNRLTGFYEVMQWKELVDTDHFPRLLDEAEKAGKFIILKINDRVFGSKKYEPPIPDSVKKIGLHYGANCYSGLVWDKRYVDEQLSFMQKVMAPLDEHPALEQMHWGETSIDHQSTHDEFVTQLIRLWRGCKTSMKHTTVTSHQNFLGGGDGEMARLRKIRDVMRLHGGGGVTKSMLR